MPVAFSAMHPLLGQIYAARGITSADELSYELTQLLPFTSLLNIDQAVQLLSDSLTQHENILIVGDFDADGATSTALAVRALRSFGARYVSFLVPNRFTEGYGLSEELVMIAKKRHPHLIITVDNGISNHAGVIAAKKLGIKVLVTDHHLPGDTLPPADVIVNPNQPFDLFPSKNIAGVGVIFYVMLALRRHLVELNWFQQQNIPEPLMSRFLDLVALGTVADVVPLDRTNRLFVHQGLKRIQAGYAVPGIIALLEVANRIPARMTTSDLGFAVAPRLNAAGRLDDMSLGIECLLCDDLLKAREMARQLDQLNDERRVIEQEMQTQALRFLKKCEPALKELPRGLCLFDPEWHQGVIGILASRIKDRYHRPVIAFALANEFELKGSARSIKGIHIRDILSMIFAKKPHLISKFGGHAMAAGLTIPRALFEDFSKIFNEIISSQLKETDLEHCLISDGELRSHDLNLAIAEIIRAGGPWGQAFEEPLFDGIFELLEQRLVGGKHLKMTLALEELILDGIAFNVDLTNWPNYRAKYVKIAYKMDVNEFRGKRKIQLIIDHVEEN